MEKIIEFINKFIRERSQMQGHTLTGKFEAGLTGEVKQTDKGWDIIGYDTAGVGEYIDRHLPASQVPYNPGSGARRSKFIDGLTRYAELRFNLSGKEAKSAAFAMATVMKREGISTDGAKRYSRNGKRTGVITDSLKENWPAIKAEINKEFKNAVDSRLTKILKAWQ